VASCAGVGSYVGAANDDVQERQGHSRNPSQRKVCSLTDCSSHCLICRSDRDFRPETDYRPDWDRHRDRERERDRDRERRSDRDRERERDGGSGRGRKRSLSPPSPGSKDR
jgi:hypothetical protein